MTGGVSIYVWIELEVLFYVIVSISQDFASDQLIGGIGLCLLRNMVLSTAYLVKI